MLESQYSSTSISKVLLRRFQLISSSLVFQNNHPVIIIPSHSSSFYYQALTPNLNPAQPAPKAALLTPSNPSSPSSPTAPPSPESSRQTASSPPGTFPGPHRHERRATHCECSAPTDTPGLSRPTGPQGRRGPAQWGRSVRGSVGPRQWCL